MENWRRFLTESPIYDYEPEKFAPLSLYHEDNGDMHNKSSDKQKDFYDGKEIYMKAFEYKDIGYTNMTWDEEVFDLEGMENVKWVKSTNYKVDGKSLG